MQTTLGELLQVGGTCDAWENFDPEAWWWCSTCSCVCQEKEIQHFRYSDGYSWVGCPHCGQDYLGGSYHNLWWYHGWPSLVLVGWVPLPESGGRFELPYEVSGSRSYNSLMLRRLISLHSGCCVLAVT